MRSMPALTSPFMREAEALSTEAVSRVERVGRVRESTAASPWPVARAACQRVQVGEAAVGQMMLKKG